MEQTTFPMSRQGSIMFYIMLGLLVIFLAFFIALIVLMPHGKAVTIGGAILCLLSILKFLSDRRSLCSCLLLNNRGITSSCWGTKDIFIAWEDCQDVAIVSLDLGYGLLLCFSKKYLAGNRSQQLKKVRRPSKNCVRAECTIDILNELKKYIDIERVRNLELFKEKHGLGD